MKAFTVLIIVVLASQASAQALNCRGIVTNAYISSSGDFTIRASYRGDYTKICSVNDDPVKCSLWASFITASITSDKEVIVRYSDIESCSTLKTYGGAPAPSYVMIVR